MKKKNIVKKLSRIKKSNIYCSGIQILNPYQINKAINNTEDFNILWNRLIIKKKLYVSDIIPKKWYTIDDLNHLKTYKKILNNV